MASLKDKAINIAKRNDGKHKPGEAKKFLDKIYQEANEKFDGRIDLSELDRKLDSHKISLKKSLRKPNSNHIKNFSAFYKYICFLLEKRPSTIKLILINISENLFYMMRYLKYEIYFKIKKFLLW